MDERLWILAWLVLCLVGQLYVIPVWLRHKPFLTVKWRLLHAFVALLLAHMALTSGWLMALLFLLVYTTLFPLQILFFLVTEVPDEESEEDLWSVIAASLLMAGELLFWPAMALILPTSEDLLAEMTQAEAEQQGNGEEKEGREADGTQDDNNIMPS